MLAVNTCRVRGAVGKVEDRIAQVPARAHESPLPLLENFPWLICLENFYSSLNTQLFFPSSVQSWLLPSSSGVISVGCWLLWWHPVQGAICLSLSPSGSVRERFGGWHHNHTGRDTQESLLSVG